MPKSKVPSINVSRAARVKARRIVSMACKKRQARRSIDRTATVRRLARIRKLLAEITRSAATSQRNLGPEIRAAIRASGKTDRRGKEAEIPIAAVDTSDRPLRLIAHTKGSIGQKKLHALITETLKLHKDRNAFSIHPLLPKLRKQSKRLSGYWVVEFAANRRLTSKLRPRIADTLRRTGAFVSVRTEGLRMGLYSGGGTGPGYEMDDLEDTDWYLTSPDPSSPDFRGYPGGIDIYGAWRELSSLNVRGEPGNGFVIGHPDTGFRIHEDYPASQIDLRNAYNAFLGSTTPGAFDLETQNFARHGLTPTGFPYYERHGTFTASVIVGPRNSNGVSPVEDVVGVAPGATVLPLRCVNTVILAGDVEVTAAVEHAIERDVDVISISLGGAPNPSLRDALSVAVEQGIIVVAAAGQSQGYPVSQHVAAPACYPEVIAVGGSIGPLPWEGAFHGPEVDICAPAVQIYHASFRANGDERFATSAGTSFATAITAGLATLWLQMHGGRQAIEQAVPGVSVQQVFRHQLKETAVDTTIFADDPPPGGWPTSMYGEGLINARALLRRPLPLPDDVPPVDPNPPFNPYGAASGIAILDISEPGTLAAVNALFTGVASTMEFAQEAPEMVGDMWSDFWEGPVAGTATTVSSWVGSLGNVSSLATESLRANAAARAWEDALAAAGSVGGELGEMLDDAADAAGEAWEDAEDAVDQALDEAGDAVDEFVDATGSLIEETAESTSETAGEIVGAVTDTLGGLFG